MSGAIPLQRLWVYGDPKLPVSKTVRGYNCISFLRCSFYILDHSLSGLFILYKGGKTMALRADKQGAHRVAFDKNRKRLLKTENVCGICGKPINKKLKAPDPMSPVVDHIIPINKGGHPSAIENLQLAHWTCNRQKSDKLFNNKKEETKVIGNRNLPKSLDWTLYSG